MVFTKGHTINADRYKDEKVKAKISKALMGRPNGLIDEKNGRWKGEEVGYDALHDYIKAKLGRPKVCQKCLTQTAKKYEWANISGKYKRDFSDWIRLCTKCHHKLDNIYEKSRITRNKNKINKNKNANTKIDPNKSRPKSAKAEL